MSIIEVKYCAFDEKFSFPSMNLSNNSFVKGWTDVIDIWPDNLKNKIEKYMPILVHDGINNAHKGVIQDPAGSAIGSQFVFGGGASGAIYDSFELEPIPRIVKTGAIFNSTSDPEGKRILHTHSPTLSGDPEKLDDFMEVVRTLANSYLNAMIAFIIRRNQLGEHGQLLNLVPISASIYGGRFRREDLGSFGHMDPSITLVAIALAIGILIEKRFEVPKLKLYFYEKEVFDRAKEYLQQ